VEKLAADAGETVQFNEILMLGGDTTLVGAPFVAGAAVQAEVVDQIKGDKVIHFVKRRRKHSSQRTKGHRQQLTLLKITSILAEGGDKTGVKAAVGAGSAPRPTAAAAPQAAKAAPVAAASTGDDLTQITGVGPAAAKKLNDAGINTFADLAAVDPETFSATKVKAEWVEQAKTLA
jgi:large subunit ribosomal protein L21